MGEWMDGLTQVSQASQATTQEKQLGIFLQKKMFFLIIEQNCL